VVLEIIEHTGAAPPFELPGQSALDDKRGEQRERVERRPHAGKEQHE
jgi:hypothetical protein